MENIIYISFSFIIQSAKNSIQAQWMNEKMNNNNIHMLFVIVIRIVHIRIYIRKLSYYLANVIKYRLLRERKRKWEREKGSEWENEKVNERVNEKWRIEREIHLFCHYLFRLNSILCIYFDYYSSCQELRVKYNDV